MDCLAFGTRRAGRAVTNYMSVLLRPIDLTAAQYGLLAAIFKNPERSLREISVALLLDESTMTRNLAVLERRGLVVMEGGRGRGGKRVSLTDDGRKLWRKGSRIWAAGHQALVDAMAARDVEAGRRFLTALTDASEKLYVRAEHGARQAAE
jgi:DNA-binding MarR family transcriptional regulator